MLTLLWVTLQAVHGDPFSLGGDPRVDPDQFRLTTFAEGLDYPTSMQQLADGSLLVATSRPAESRFFDSTGELLRLVDDDQNGIADAPATVLYTGLPGAVTSVRQAADLFYVVSIQAGSEQISLLRGGSTPNSPLSLVGNIALTYASGWQHKAVALAVRENPGKPANHDLFFNVGSRSNFANTVATVSASGLMTAVLQGDSIYTVTVTDNGGETALSGLTQIATGLRNAAGMAFHPVTGDLYLQDNGIDGSDNEALSADELNVIALNQIGGAVEDFGFADSYVEYRTGNVVGGGGIQPLIAFQPIPDLLTGNESEGPFEITFAPPGFPDGLNNGIFVGFHGRFSLAGLDNEENPLVYVDLATGDYFHFVGVDEAEVGHLDGLLATEDALFVADISSAGSLGTGGGTGVIYQIQVIDDASPLPGDANNDGQVTGADLIAVQQNFGAAGPPNDGTLPGDANDDGFVTGADLIAVQQNFGSALPLSSASVPEPSSLLMVAVYCVTWVGGRW